MFYFLNVACGWTEKEERVEELAYMLICLCQAHSGWTKKEEKVEELAGNVLTIKVMTWAQQANKSLIVSNLELEFFLFQSSTNISAKIRRYGRNDPVQASILTGIKHTHFYTDLVTSTKNSSHTGWYGMELTHLS